MSAIRLTVGIPTYNRAVDLSVAIESVLAQLNGRFRDQVEILISDNASTDATREIVHAYMAQYPGVVTYRCNPGNAGFSRNVDAVVCHARGDFVLLLGDDDGLDDHALATLWGILDQHGDVGVVFLSATPYDSELCAPVGELSDPGSRHGGVLYRPGLEYVRQTRIFPPFLVSGYVIRREAWVRSNPAEFFDTICVHTLATLRILIDYAAFLSLVPSIRYRTENKKGGNCWLDELYPFTFHLNLLVGCRGVKAIYPAKLYNYLHRQAMRSVIYHIMDQKVTGGRINAALLRRRLKELADPGDLRLLLSCLLLRMPAWAIVVPFKVVARWRSAVKRTSN